MKCDPDEILGVRNPLVRKIKTLHAAVGRRASGLFLVEGRNALEEAIRAGWPLWALVFTPEWESQSSHRSLIEQVRMCMQPSKRVGQAGAPLGVKRVSPEALRAMSTTRSPDGVLLIAEMQCAEERQAVLMPHIQSQKGVVLALDGVQDPGNLGSLIRSAQATGTKMVILSPESADPYGPKVIRSAAGQWFHSPPVRARSKEEWQLWMAGCSSSKRPVFVAAAADSCAAESISSLHGYPLWSEFFSEPCVLILGSEGQGVSEQTASFATARVEIPMQRGVESLNVATGGALLLYELLRKKQQV